MLFVGRPRRARHQGRSRGTKRLGQSRRSFPGARPDLVVAGVAGHADSVVPYTLLAQSLGVLFLDCSDPLDGAIGVAEQCSRKKAPTSRGFGQRRADDADGNTGDRGLLGERGPDIQLAEHDDVRPKSVDYRRSMGEGIERQEVRKIRLYRARELFRAWRIKSVGDLHVGPPGTDQLDHRKRLQPFSDRRRVKPGQRFRAITRFRAPLGVSIDESAPCAQSAPDFRVSGRRYSDETFGGETSQAVRYSQQRIH